MKDLSNKIFPILLAGKPGMHQLVSADLGGFRKGSTMTSAPGTIVGKVLGLEPELSEMKMVREG
jgi:hypothetical protein